MFNAAIVWLNHFALKVVASAVFDICIIIGHTCSLCQSSSKKR